MAENTKIEWADHSWNPWSGCTKVSPACDHCYAEGWAKRSGIVVWGAKADRRRTTVANWKKPLKWQKEAKAADKRFSVFCASLADVFDNHKSIEQSWRDDLWQLIRDTPDLDWMLLTKRPQNYERFLPDDWGSGYPNVWLGTTVENQEEAERRIPHLLRVNAIIHFLSCEPLLGPLNLSRISLGRCEAKFRFQPELNQIEFTFNALTPTNSFEWPRLDWVIAGGESGHGARPSHPDWFRSLRDQCAEAGVEFHFKQWGEWLPWEPEHGPCWVSQARDAEDSHNLFPDDIDFDPKWDDGLWAINDGEGHAAFQKVGKKAAGRLLDGQKHNGMPTVEAD